MTARNRAATTFGQVVRTLVPRLGVAAAAVSLIAACDQEQTPTNPQGSLLQAGGSQQGTFYGAAVKIGDGVGRSYYTMEGGSVVEVGVALSEAALRGLPVGEGHHHGNRHQHKTEYVLKMHPQNPTPYQHVGLNWMPEGHPGGPYALPHFDFHFYTISETERNAIDPSNPQWLQKARNLPSSGLIPANYLPAHVLFEMEPEEETIPRMGLHWIDVTSEELHGAPFTATFIYGSFDGQFIFAEPMITKAFLESKPNVTKSLPVAQQGYNPGSYRIYWSEARKEYRVALANLPQQ